MIQQERDSFQDVNDQYAKELSQLKHQMKQLQIKMNQQHPGSQPLSPVPPPRQHNHSRPISAPRIQPQARPVEMSFRPVPAQRHRIQTEPQTEDQIRSPPHSPSPTSAPLTQQSSSFHYMPQWGHRSDVYYSQKQDPSSSPYRDSQDPARHPQPPHRSITQSPPPVQELMYRGPIPMIPDFIHPNPREFSQLNCSGECPPS